MLTIQILLIIAVATGGAFLLRSNGNARHVAARRLLLLAFVAFAVVSVLNPGLITDIAQLIGVGRGTDLVLYLLFVAFLGFVVSSYRRERETERRLTVLTRQLALDEVGSSRQGAPLPAAPTPAPGSDEGAAPQG